MYKQKIKVKIELPGSALYVTCHIKSYAVGADGMLCTKRYVVNEVKDLYYEGCTMPEFTEQVWKKVNEVIDRRMVANKPWCDKVKVREMRDEDEYVYKNTKYKPLKAELDPDKYYYNPDTEA